MRHDLAWRLAGAVLVSGALGCLGSGAGAAGAAPAVSGMASQASVEFTVAAAAPVLQATEDEPTSQFHPEGEGDYGYTIVTANPSAATALAAVMWPGSAAGNAGTLAEVLGGPSSLSALNDPVQASATTGTSQTHSSISAPTGSTMSASVDPSATSDPHATATSTMGGGGLGRAGSVANSSSTSTIDFNTSTGVLSATATSSASDLDVGGVVQIGSVTSSASAQAVNGGTPQVSGATAFHNMTVAGEAAYVDGSGVHLGTPGAPAGPAAVDAVNAALAAAGMQVYFTAPHTITVGGTSYYYAASVLFFWAPPNDPSSNSFTLSVGGAAVSMTDSSEPDSTSGLGGDSSATGGAGGTGSTTATGSAPDASAGVAAAGGLPASTPASAGDGSPSASLAALSSGTPGTTGGATLSLPASPAAAASGTAAGGASSPLRASARLPGGVGAGWWVLAVIAALVGAGLTTRLPALLQRQAAAVCPRPGRPASTFDGRKVP